MISKDLKIEIRPIPNRGDIKSFSENLEYFSQAHTIMAFVDPVTRRYSTGLTKEDVKYLKDKGFPYNLDDTYIQGVPHEFWESAITKVSLTNSPMFLSPGKNDLDFIKWKYLMVNNYIYTSEEEMKTGSKPEATHYIYNEQEATSLKATTIEKRNSLINQVSKLSLKRKRDVILVLLNESTENKDEEYITVRLDDIFESKDLSRELENLLKQKIEDVSLSAEIKSAIQKNVLKRTKQGIYFFESNLGFTEDAVKEFLSQEENQEILISIQSKI